METTAIVETTEAVVNTATTTIPVDLDVNALNQFVYIGTALMLAVFVWTIGKWAYRFFKMFFQKGG